MSGRTWLRQPSRSCAHLALPNYGPPGWLSAYLPRLLASRPPRTAPRSNLIPRPGACISSAPSSPSRSAYLADPTTIHTFQTTSFSAAGAVEGASPQPKVGARVGCGTNGWLAGSLVLDPDQAAVWRASNALL